ncbi:MAG: lipid II flippase MurJ [Dysosmobacter sp.]|uniref:murein biosynthesis integral membrane protein MurJ n=1 Tax=Dysosmobacter sp. TaxID=2591382 RepID=UPI00284F3512|nr:lipid II flippase MurJ [Dysosmobacter sp.]MDR3983048.1 lipid II flippase MurJ [Dysosmobacter sp.]
MKQSRLLKSILSVSGVLILVKVLGFVKQMVIAASFGANANTDLINLSYGFIGNAQYLLVQVMLTAVVSVYIHVKGENEKEANQFASYTLVVSTVIAAVISVLICGLSSWVARLLAPSYSPELIRQLSSYLRLFSPILIPLVWMAVFHALLNGNQRFVPGQLEGLYQSVILVAVITLGSSSLGVNSLALGYWLYAVISAAILGVQARRYFGRSHGNPFRNPHIQSLLHMMGPLLIGYGAVYINQMVDKILVSGLESGTVTAMSYAAVLANLVGTLICSLCSVLYAHLTEQISRGNKRAVSQLTERTVLLLTVLLLPVTVIAVAQSEDIVHLVYGRGVFDNQAADMTAQALRGYCLYFIPLALREIYSCIQYGYQDSKRPTRNSVIGIVCNIILSILLCPVLGVFGVTFASSVSTLVIGGLNMHSARQDAPFLSFQSFWKAAPFLTVGGATAILLSWLCGQWFSGFSVLIRLCLNTICVFAAYGMIVCPMLWKMGLFNQLFPKKSKF